MTRVAAGRSARIWAAVLALACGAGVPAASGQQPGGREPAPPEDVASRLASDPLVAAALAAPAEHGAHLLLSLAEAGRIQGAAETRFAVEAAVAKAADAAEPYRVRLVDGLAVDSREGYRSSALQMLALDELSLRCRAVERLLEVAPRDARWLFERTPEDLGLKRVECGDALAPDVDRFYATLARVLARGFTAAERERGLDAALAGRYVSGIRSAAQVAPALRFVLAVDLGPGARAALVADFAAAVERVEPSYRLFEYSFSDPGAVELVSRAVARAREAGLEKRLASALRVHVLRCLGDRRCADTADGASPVPEFVVRLNGAAFRERPITSDDLDAAPASGDAPRPHDFWRSPRSREALVAFQELRAEREAMESGKSETTEAAWRQRLDRFLDLLRAWKADDEASEEDYASQRCALYTTLYRVAPDEVARRDVTREFLTFLKRYDLRGSSRAVWIMFAAYYAAQVRGEELARLLDAYEASGDATLAAYAAAQRSGVDALGIGAGEPPP